MEAQTLQALIPAIPGMITAGLEVWKTIVKPLLDKTGYNPSKEQEQEMLELELKKDIPAFIEKLEGINKEISQTVFLQSQTGDNNLLVGKNEGIIDNSKIYNYGVAETTKAEIKKN